MISSTVLVEGCVDFSSWNFGCGEFDGLVRKAAQDGVAETLADDPPTIYISGDDKPLDVRVWLSFLADEDAGPTYRFNLEELLVGEIDDYCGGDDYIDETGMLLLNELEAMVRRLRDKYQHRKVPISDKGRALL